MTIPLMVLSWKGLVVEKPKNKSAEIALIQSRLESLRLSPEYRDLLEFASTILRQNNVDQAELLGLIADNILRPIARDLSDCSKSGKITMQILVLS